MVKTDTQTGILYGQWESRPSAAVFLLIHGFGAHIGRWSFFSEFLLNRNISSYALVLRGFGQTKGLRGDIDSFNTYFEDIRRLHDIIKKEHPGEKIFIAGESLGGLITFLSACLQPLFFEGVICISPAFKGKVKFSLLEYGRIFTSFLYNPVRQFILPLNPQMYTQDADFQKMIDEESLEHRFATSRFLINLLMAQIRVRFLMNKFNRPVLFLLSGSDEIVDVHSSRKIFSRLKVSDKTIIDYPCMSHALSIGEGKERVFEDIWNWVDKRL